MPVLASDRGGLPELVSADDLLPPGDGERWGRRLAALWSDRQALQRAGDAALQRARARFSEDVYYERLMEIYGG